jgi:hypothetical protein
MMVVTTLVLVQLETAETVVVPQDVVALYPQDVIVVVVATTLPARMIVVTVIVTTTVVTEETVPAARMIGG